MVVSWLCLYAILTPIAEGLVSIVPIEHDGKLAEVLRFFLFDTQKVLMLLAGIVCVTFGMVVLRESLNAAGVSPFAKWREKLDAVTRARVTVAVLRLETGNSSAVKGAGAGIFELRMDFGPGYRVYFGKDGERLVILLGGGTKRRQQHDIEAAQAHWQEYKMTKGRRENDGRHTEL